MAEKVRPERSSGRVRNGSVPDEPIPLDQLIDRENEQHPGLRDAVELGVQRRRFLSQMARLREEHGFSQQEVATRMGTGQPAVARLESGVVDPKFSTLQKYTGAIGLRIELMDGARPSATG
jgi:DNA-binding XRE family transcriptional regulator